ncbi:tyrosine-type recombinase/integrase [Reichenbachiella versicolor]|uniref:tyrosine-type recombinase/integrase n=1 Tax=Reichenbachiella versicolor TaxID=1821036 RepID=UPI001629364A|nr:tyrosine-type recombinase/integrase [Reichenbachiella versicolor]
MVKKFIKYLSSEKRYSDHTLNSYETDLLQYESFLNDSCSIVDIEHSQPIHVRAWVLSLVEAKINSRSINRKLASLRSFFNFLLSREVIVVNPVKSLRPLKVDKSIPHFVQAREMDDLLDRSEFDNTFEDKRVELILELLYGLGIRLSELIGIQDKDIDVYNHTIKVLGKRNKERILPLSKSNLELIKTYKMLRDDTVQKQCTFLLVTNSGKKSYPVMINRIVKKNLSSTTVHKKSPHVLRHSFATHMLDNGADLNAVKDLLGHSSLAATQVYTHNSLEKLKSAFDLAHPKA